MGRLIVILALGLIAWTFYTSKPPSSTLELIQEEQREQRRGLSGRIRSYGVEGVGDSRLRGSMSTDSSGRVKANLFDDSGMWSAEGRMVRPGVAEVYDRNGGSYLIETAP